MGVTPEGDKIMSERDLTPREISDRIRIHDVLIRYSTAINDRDCDLLDTCFTDNALCDYSSTGGPSDSYAVVRQWFQTSLSHIEASLHRIGNIIYEIDCIQQRRLLWLYF